MELLETLKIAIVNANLIGPIALALGGAILVLAAAILLIKGRRGAEFAPADDAGADELPAVAMPVGADAARRKVATWVAPEASHGLTDKLVTKLASRRAQESDPFIARLETLA